MWRSVLLWLSVVALSSAIPEEYQYCALRYRRLCQGKGRHVACQFPDPGAGQMCYRYTPIKFTSDLKNFITHYLNRRRQRIASGNERVRGGVHLPKPQLMMLVEWDRELAMLAQRLADQCTFVHDDCRATLKFPYAGQTVGEVRWRRSSESDELSAQRAIRRVLDAWWGERRRVQPKQLTAPFRLTSKGTVWGHFSQLAVWNLQAVGCGAVRHGTDHPRLLLVCDFSHTNMLGQRTLVPGNTAPCPQHMARRLRSPYPALCGPVRQPAPHEAEPEVEDNGYDDGEEEEDVDDVETVEIDDALTPSLHKSGHQSDNTAVSITTETSLAPTTVSYEEVSKNSESPIFIEEPALHRDPSAKRASQHPLVVQQYAITMAPILPSQATRQLTMERDGVTEEGIRRKSDFEHDQFFKPMVRERPTKMLDRPTKVLDRPTKKLDRPTKKLDRPTKKIYDRPLVNWRADQERPPEPDRGQEVIPLTRRPAHSGLNPRLLEVYRPTVPEETTETTESYRHRWKQTRFRAQRPGANALLSTSKPPKKLESRPININLDKEDIDQLFRDTGFNMEWRKKTN
ncbi:uncharacterized protein LOC142983644 isoform X2 [Anticarsia gemmatalis]|uniref:uncharacterized protein LOC142983644 isoform X2 n=1 Tax=Anticarsia gemmatalis TaxID=129554 RepID=UPI003F7772E3